MVILVPLCVVDEVEGTGMVATDLALSRVPALEPPVPGLVLHYKVTEGEVDPQVIHMGETVIRSVEEQDSVVVALLEGPVTISIALPVRVRVLQFVVAERGHSPPGDARLVTLEVVMAVGVGQGVTLSVRVGLVLGHSRDRNRGLALCHIQVIQDIHEAKVVVGQLAEEEKQRAGAELEMIFETADRGHRDSRYKICYQNSSLYSMSYRYTNVDS